MRQRRHRWCLVVLLAFGGIGLSAQEGAAGRPPDRAPGLDCFISTGDNHWAGLSLPIDSRASIEAAFDMLEHALGIRRIYWRGLQEATMVETLSMREESFRYATFQQWCRHLIRDLDIEKMAAQIAHEKGLEFWGVGTLGDWGCAADTPGFGDFPWFWESTLRRDHPEWVPVDKYGYRRQGGPLELAYPEARKALVDLHTRLATHAGYDGIVLISYVENFSMRFQDEFGFNGPVLREYHRRFGRDLRTDEFDKNASRSDWYKLRGEYVTQYLRELKAALRPHGIRLGMFVNPRTPRRPAVWSTLPQVLYTLGNIHFDLETWVREGIVDQLIVRGAANVRNQPRTVEDCLWLTRDTDVAVSYATSSPHAAHWRPFHGKPVTAVLTVGHDNHYFTRGRPGREEAEALSHGTIWRKMAFLSQVVEGTSEAATADVLPLATHPNVLLRRLAILALGALRDPAALPAIEAALFDAENGVRCAALGALRHCNRPGSAARIFEALDRFGNHPLHEMARDTLPRIRPVPRDAIRAAAAHPNPVVRTTAIRALGLIGSGEADVSLLSEHLDDPHRYARYAAAKSLAAVRGSPAAVRVLVAATRHADVAVANRAAASLEEVVRRGGEAIESLRPEILDAVTALFMQMGDACNREDAGWGYRVSGNALLAFGETGESVLRGFLAQTDDKRLAELAWRTLYVREKAGPNAFNVITERESDEAFRQRPLFLKTGRAVRLEQSFDDPRFFGPDSRGIVGDTNRRCGRWGPWADAGPTVAGSVCRSEPYAARLVRGGGALTGFNARGVGDGCDFELEFWALRDTEQAAFLVQAKGPRPAGRIEFALFVDARGQVRLRDAAREVWVDSELRVPHGQWVRLTVLADRRAGTCGVSVLPENGVERATTVTVPLTAVRGLYIVQFVPQPPEGGVVFLDDVSLRERF